MERAVSCGTPPAPPRVNSTTISRHRPPPTPRGPPSTNTTTIRPPTPSFIRPSSFVHLTGPGRQFRDVALSPGTRLAPWSGGGQDGSLEHQLPTTVARADPSRPCTPRAAWCKTPSQPHASSVRSSVPGSPRAPTVQGSLRAPTVQTFLVT